MAFSARSVAFIDSASHRSNAFDPIGSGITTLQVKQWADTTRGGSGEQDITVRAWYIHLEDCPGNLTTIATLIESPKTTDGDGIVTFSWPDRDSVAGSPGLHKCGDDGTYHSMIWIKSFDPYGQPYGVTEIVDFMNVEDYALDNPSATVYPAEMTRIPTYNFPHTVTFDANGGSGSMSSQTTSVATALTNNAFARTGYVFTGWNTAADGSGAAYADGATYLFDADVTLYAQWLANPLTLTATSISSTGWVLESGYNTNVGGSHATVADSLYVGDSNGNAQFKDVIQFDTSVIPDNAVIDSWYIKFYTNSISGSVSGWGPAAHPNAITIASASTCFNSNCTLENADWQATGTSWYDYMNVVTNNPGWNQSNTFTNVTAIRKTGVTEFRINWVTKTDSDSSADRVNLAGPSSGNKPVLIITYHLP